MRGAGLWVFEPSVVTISYGVRLTCKYSMAGYLRNQLIMFRFLLDFTFHILVNII